MTGTHGEWRGWGLPGEAGHLSDTTKTLNFQLFYGTALAVTAASNGIVLRELHS